MKFYILSAQPMTPWGNPTKHLPNFYFTSNRWQADVWVGDKEQVLVEAIEECIQLNKRKPKFCILWTSEPYYAEHKQTTKQIYGIAVEIFTVWNGRSLFHNGAFLLEGGAVTSKAPKESLSPQPRTEWRSQGKPIVALMTYPNTLNPYTKERVELAKTGYDRGLVDIYGKGWPDSIRKGNSREGQWWLSKLPILDQYEYNLALENCIQPYYVTEKIWDPISRNCLPIYADNGTIYQDFPRQSFLDIRDYSTNEKLWEHIESMSLAEWNHRFTGCWDTYVKVWDSAKQNGWARSVEEIQKVLVARGGVVNLMEISL